MYETLKMMKSIITGKEGKVDEIELIKEYQESKSPNILAYFYIKNFGLINKSSQFYSKLNDEDKASFCLQELDNSLQTYQFNLNNKFSTYFIKCYKRRLYAENKLLDTNKRKILLNYENIDTCEILMDNEIDIVTETDVLNNWKLNDIEQTQCKLLNKGYTIKEIAKLLKVAAITIYKRNLKIKQKILNYNINLT